MLRLQISLAYDLPFSSNTFVCPSLQLFEKICACSSQNNFFKWGGITVNHTNHDVADVNGSDSWMLPGSFLYEKEPGCEASFTLVSCPDYFSHTEGKSSLVNYLFNLCSTQFKNWWRLQKCICDVTQSLKLRKSCKGTARCRDHPSRSFWTPGSETWSLYQLQKALDNLIDIWNPHCQLYTARS